MLASDAMGRGCVETPRALAEAMVAALGHTSRGTWLDPCVGGGAFIQALHCRSVPRERIVALDIATPRGRHDTVAQTARGTDFIAWSINASRKFSRIVANPPYVRLGSVPEPLRQSASLVSTPDGRRIPLRSNYWVVFLAASLRVLAHSGAIAFVLPAAWDYARYAHNVREHLPQLFEYFYVHRCRQSLFPTVKEGCIVLVGLGYGKPHLHVRRQEHASLESLVSALHNRHAWQRNETTGTSDALGDNAATRRTIAKLGEVLDVHIGGVTGDSRFFLLTESQRRSLRLPIPACKRVLSRARHLSASTISAVDWRRLKETDERVWLFRPPDRLLSDPHVAAYLVNGDCRRGYKVSTRTIWHRTPLPRRIDGFMSGMTTQGPWISFRRLAGLSATNTLYTVRFRNAVNADERSAWALSLLTTFSSRAARRLGRSYAGGLFKLEPGDLSQLPLIVPRQFDGAAESYSKAVKALLAGRISESRATADSFVVT
jgi:adenine-specific DNA-methyltransferase